MAFDYHKFIDDRNFSRPVTAEDVSNHDTYMALYTLSMTPRVIRMVNALNTVEFTKLPPKVQAKVMQGFNGMSLYDGYIRATPAEIAKVNELRDRVMALYGVASNDADFIINSGQIDPDEINEMYDYKFNGVVPAKKVSRGKRKSD